MADQQYSGSGARPAAPVAVIGLAARLPGAATVDAFWRMLCEGRDAVRPVPASRWPGTAEDTPRIAGLLDDVAGFDAAFFGISPREAAAMDPQQRLALELAWEALDESGLAADRTRGTATGVYLGVGPDEYAHLTAQSDAIGPHTLTGTHRAVVANRVSYAFDLRGPSLAVDTGQSSGLVAIHLAAEAVATGVCAMALAGGISLALLGGTSTATQRLGALSPDGRCYTFDARANGYVRGEGGVVVLLKPLADALADGDPVYCVVLGGATNNDGCTRSLTTPSQRGQQALLAQAYRRAGVDPADVGYVELHGTGTPVGDPVEAAALGAVIGRGRTVGSALRVGSVKTNVGHLEAAAGAVGFLKVALALAYGKIPPTLNHERAHPSIPDSLGLRVVRETIAWPHPDRPRIAGVSAFGMGGTNCHVVLASPDAVAGDRADVAADGWADAMVGSTTDAFPGMFEDGPIVLPLSAHGDTALRAAAAAVAAMPALADPASVPADPDGDNQCGVGPRGGEPFGPVAVGRALAATRTGFAHRAVAVARDAAAARDALTALARGLPCVDLVEGTALSDVPEAPVFVFSGQGAQWPGMADELLDQCAAFRGRMAACERALRPYVDWSLAEALRDRIDRVDVLQPVLFAVMVSMAAAWRAAGVAPGAVIGHSQGEIAAACVAGALSLQDAARIVAVRARAVATLSGAGGMLSVQAGADEITARLAGGLEIAAVNGPHHVVVAGPPAELAELARSCAAAGIRSREVAVDYAAHTSAIDGLRADLARDLAGLTPRAPRTAFWSSVTGEVVTDRRLDGSYWYRNLRQPVRFQLATQGLLGAGHRVFVEMAPHPVLAGAIADTASQAGVPAYTVASLRRGDGGPQRFLLGLAEAYTYGVAVDWPAVTGREARRPRLPAYPFQRRRVWLDDAPEPAGSQIAAAREASPPAETTPAETTPALVNSADTLEVVRAHTAAVLGYRDLAEVPADLPFTRLGLESFTALQLRNRLVAATGVELAAACAYDHPTPAALARHIDERRDVGDTDAVLGHLTRLAGTARTLPAGDGLRHQVAARLRDLAAELAGPDDGRVEGVDDASIEELFDLIDRSYLTRGGHE